MSEREQIHNSYADRLEATGFKVYQGWDSEVARTLIGGAREPHIREATPRDELIRFPDIFAADKWYRDERKRHTIYTLADTAIGGVIWFSYEPYTRAVKNDEGIQYLTINDTFAIRMYQHLQGRRLAGVFLEAAHSDFATRNNGQPTWLATRPENERALSLYSSHGYQIAEYISDTSLTMVRDPKAIEAEYEREYQASHNLDNL